MYRVKPTTLFRKVLWFENRGRFDIDYFEMLQPRREVMPHRKYRSGLYHSEKCGRDIQYESALELAFIQATGFRIEIPFSDAVTRYRKPPMRQ